MKQSMNPISRMKRRTKQLIVVFSAVIGSMILYANPVFATGQPLDFSFSETKVEASQIVEGSIVLKSDQVTNGMISVNYDSDKLQLIAAEKPEHQDTLYVSVNDTKKGEILIAFVDKNKLENSELVDLTFRVNDQVKPGDILKTNADISQIYDGDNQQLNGTEITEEFIVEEGAGVNPDENVPSTPDGSEDNQGHDTQSDKENETNHNSQTGDNADLVYLAFICAIAGSGLFYLLKRKKDDKNA